MNSLVHRIYPFPSQELPLRGLYLEQDLRVLSQQSGKPFVIGNFITSLDGRIAIPHPTKPGMTVPEDIANPRDWRLFQELAVQADIIITTGRYFRDYADGRAQEILRVYDDSQLRDLQNWRTNQGLAPQPDLAVVSSSLNFPIPEILAQMDRTVVVFTTRNADQARMQALEAQGAKIRFAGEQSVEGQQLVAQLAGMGYQTIYSASGPKILHMLILGEVLDRLYLTFAHRLLGGQPFSSIIDGKLFAPAVNTKLNTLFFDPHGLDGVGQLFGSYDISSA